jgi:GTP cyclohydrolase IA
LKGKYKLDKCARCGTEINTITIESGILCDDCFIKFKRQNNIEKFTGIHEIEEAGKLILKGLERVFGLDITDPNFTDTPRRMARAYYEIFEGINATDEINDILSTSFPSDYSGMVVAKDICVFSTCPHHILPVEYKVNLGYIPSEKVLGISKLSRLVELLAKQPKLQEDFTNDIVTILDNNINPKGMIVQVSGRHMCMAMRGAKQKDSWTLTSRITGNFENEATRNEFQLLLRGNG